MDDPSQITPVGDGVAITLYPGNTITCTFVNVKTELTRTLGFWKTHTTFTSTVFSTYFPGINGMPIGTAPHKGNITNSAGLGQSQFFGAYYANTAKTTSNVKRSAVDQARIQLVRQLITAKLNAAYFGASSSIMTLIANADAAYATGTKEDILYYAGELDDYNNSGDTGIISPSPGSATPGVSQGRANIAFWNLP
jgi:hypothetical protein